MKLLKAAIVAAALSFASGQLYSKPLRVAFVGDPQVDSPTELSYARRSIFKELRERKDIDLVVILGDLVNNRMELLAPSKESLDSLPCTWLCAPGNHDKDHYPKEMKRPRDLVSFGQIIHTPDTCITMGGVRFISMDDVRTVGIASYEGGLSEKQKTWLDGIICSAPEVPTVLSMHIPFEECTGRDSLVSILSKAEKLLITTGHIHMVRRYTAFADVEDISAGATCGSWWRGVKDENGIPYALMNCGTPRGYFTADFRPKARKWYSLQYKVVGSDSPCSARMEGDSLVVNVFGGRIGGSIKGMHQAKLIAPEVADVIQANNAASREYRRAHREEFIPMRRLASFHVWVSDPGKSGKAQTGRRVKIRYRDASMKFNTTVTVQ